MFCSKCGSNIPSGSHFCSKCGTSLSSFPSIGSGIPVNLPATEMNFGYMSSPAATKSKKGWIIFFVILILLVIALIGVLIYLNNDEARIQDCMDKFSVACSNGDYSKAASCCTGSLKTALKTADKLRIDYKGFGTSYGDLSTLIMSVSGESLQLTVMDIDFYGNRADVTVEVESSNKWGSSTDTDTVTMVKVFGLFWKIEQI